MRLSLLTLFSRIRSFGHSEFYRISILMKQPYSALDVAEVFFATLKRKRLGSVLISTC